jgi:hypothetical protein
VGSERVSTPDDRRSRTMRLSHPMKILTMLTGTLVLNMFDASNCRADETLTEAMLRRSASHYSPRAHAS